MAANILLRVAKDICSRHNIKPARSRGQSFLVNSGVYKDIIAASEVSAWGRVLEVGPGLGFLTEELCEKAGEVAAVEVDKNIYFFLKERMSDCANLNLLHADILKKEPEELFNEDAGELNHNYKIVANLPYNITSIFLRRFLSEVVPPSSMVLMLQKEVAERLVATPPPGILSVMVQFYSHPRMIRAVPRNDFWPSPEVDSSVVKISVKRDTPAIDTSSFFRLVRYGFASRRKMLKNNLSSFLSIPASDVGKILEKEGVKTSARAQELCLQDWIRVFKRMEKCNTIRS